MDLETQKIFVRSALYFAKSGTLNLNNEQLINMFEECGLMGASLQDDFSFVLAHERLAELYYKLSRFDKALRSNNFILPIFQRTGAKQLESYIHGNLGNCCRCLGQHEKAVKHHKMSLSIAKQIGDKTGEAKALGNLGVCYCHLAQYEEAVKHHEMSLNIAREIRNKAEEGNAYNNLGNCFRCLGQYRNAVKHHEMSLNIAKELGERSLEGIVYGNLGVCYYSLGQCEKAVKHHEMSLNIAREIRNKAEEASAYNSLGDCFRFLGQHENAIKHHEMSLNIAKELGDRELEGIVYGHLGICYFSLGQYDKAIKHCEVSLKIAKELRDRAGEGNVYGNLGSCFRSLGQYEKAVKHYEMSLNIARDIGDKATEGATYGNLGSCYLSLGQYDKAVKHHEISLNIAKKLGDKELEGIVYGNLGIFYYSLGQYDKAVKHYEMGLNIAGRIGDKSDEVKAYCNLGSCYRSLGKYKKAVKYYETSLNIAKEIADKATEGATYGNLGSCYLSLGKHDKAVKNHEMGLNIAKELGDMAGEGSEYGNLGSCYLSLGQYDKAVKHYEMNLNIAKQIGDMAEEGVSYNNLGNYYYLRGQFDKAVFNLKEGLKRFDDLFQNTPQTDELKISVRENFSKSYRLLVNVLIEQHKENEALVFCERGRARALVDLMRFKYFLHGYKTEENLLDFTDVPRLVTSLQSPVLYLALTNNCIYIWIIQLNGSIQFEKISLPVQRKDRYPNEAFAPLNEQINSLISKFRSSCAPIECEDRSLSRLDYECPKEFSEEGSQFRCIEEEDNDDAETSPLQTLHQIILASVQDHIKENEVIIVPEGPLHLVPFAALMDENGRYVSESLRVRIVPSLTTAKMILEKKFESKEQMKPLIVGDPDFGYLHRLPGANEEARRVAKLFNTDPLIGKEATKEKVLLSIENASLIHIAAHGDMERGEIALARNPRNTGTSTEQNKEDSMLMMADLEHKRLKAKLVVLSCCHSARGKITSEGVVGIARAFLGAGARSVLVALWAINDGATLYFMERFYEHLTQGKSAGESLSEAMAAMRASGIYNDPPHWAPFVLIGDDVSVC